MYKLKKKDGAQQQITKDNFYRFFGATEYPRSLDSARKDYSSHVALLRKYTEKDPSVVKDIQLADSAYFFARTLEREIWGSKIEERTAKANQNADDNEKIINPSSSLVKTRKAWKDDRIIERFIGTLAFALGSLCTYLVIKDAAQPDGWEAFHTIGILASSAFAGFSLASFKRARAITKLLSLSKRYSTYGEYEAND
jgi:hypothetical protein